MAYFDSAYFDAAYFDTGTPLGWNPGDAIGGVWTLHPNGTRYWAPTIRLPASPTEWVGRARPTPSWS